MIFGAAAAIIGTADAHAPDSERCVLKAFLEVGQLDAALSATRADLLPYMEKDCGLPHAAILDPWPALVSFALAPLRHAIGNPIAARAPSLGIFALSVNNANKSRIFAVLRGQGIHVI